ncbi:ELM1/GtrOC1 family putative glycosyltransferase [Thermodesulfobacteriota bacterium]
MKPLSIVAYYDGRPGHEKQTRGILNALTDITSIEVDSIKVSIAPSVYLKNWITYLLPFFQRLSQGKNFHSVDLIIGTGTHTHIPMLMRKRQQRKLSKGNARLVTCMTPDVLLRNKFDLCFIPIHDTPPLKKNIFITQGPPATVNFEGRHKAEKGLILVGGIDKKSHIWKSEEIISQIEIIFDKNPTLQWTVSSSPRTPENTCKKLHEIASGMKQVSFFRSEDTPAGWVEEQYALNQTVWVTADSISMVYEALAAGCSVGILPVDWLHPDNKFNKSLNFLSEEEMIVDFDAWQQGTSMPRQKNEKFNESIRCAREILRRWWPERLQ